MNRNVLSETTLQKRSDLSQRRSAEFLNGSAWVEAARALKSSPCRAETEDVPNESPAKRRGFWTRMVANAERDALAVWRRDGWLILGLLFASLVSFEGSVRKAFEVARQVEVSYGLALLPALFILCGLLAFHQYTKRQEMKTEAAAAAAEAVQVRERLGELERLSALGHALAGCLTFDALQQVVWKHLPGFVGPNDAWLLAYNGATWQVVADTSGLGADWLEPLQALAVQALAEGAEGIARGDGVDCEGVACFPMIVGGQVVGVLGLEDASTAELSRRRMMGAAAALLAIATRNVQLFLDVRDDALHDRLTGCLGRAHGLDARPRAGSRGPHPTSALRRDVRHRFLQGDQRSVRSPCRRRRAGGGGRAATEPVARQRHEVPLRRGRVPGDLRRPLPRAPSTSPTGCASSCPRCGFRHSAERRCG